jgi:hypothetical protein
MKDSIEFFSILLLILACLLLLSLVVDVANAAYVWVLDVTGVSPGFLLFGAVCITLGATFLAWAQSVRRD